VDLKAVRILEDIHFAVVRSQLKAVGKLGLEVVDKTEWLSALLLRD
jgi:hypothetical protein